MLQHITKKWISQDTKTSIFPGELFLKPRTPVSEPQDLEEERWTKGHASLTIDAIFKTHGRRDLLQLEYGHQTPKSQFLPAPLVMPQALKSFPLSSSKVVVVEALEEHAQSSVKNAFLQPAATQLPLSSNDSNSLDKYFAKPADIPDSGPLAEGNWSLGGGDFSFSGIHPDYQLGENFSFLGGGNSFQLPPSHAPAPAKPAEPEVPKPKAIKFIDGLKIKEVARPPKKQKLGE